MSDDTPDYNLKAIRELLLEAFSADDFPRFLKHDPKFRHIVAEFKPDYSFSDMVDKVIDHCQSHILWPEFLAAVQQARPDTYALFETELRTPAPAAPVSRAAAMPSTATYYNIICKESDKCLEVEGGGTQDRANVVQNSCHGGDAQQWEFVDERDGFYRIRAKHSSKCLDVQSQSTKDRANVQQYACHDDDNQKWQLVDVGDGYYQIRVKHSGKCLDVRAHSAADLANVQQYSWHRGDNQQWKLVQVTAATRHPVQPSNDKPPAWRWTLLIAPIAAVLGSIIWLLVGKEVEALIGILLGVAGLVVYFRSTSRWLDVAVAVILALVFVSGLVYIFWPPTNGSDSQPDTPTPTLTPMSAPSPTWTPTPTHSPTWTLTPTATATISSTTSPTSTNEERWIDKGNSAYFFDGQLVISLLEVSDDGKVHALIGSAGHPNAEIADDTLGSVIYYQSDNIYEIRITGVVSAWATAKFLVTCLPGTPVPTATSSAPTNTPTPTQTTVSQTSILPPTDTPERTPIPPTATPTSKPPTVTSTPPSLTSIPPSRPPTDVPPTDTPLPPTDQPTPIATTPPAFSFDWDTQITCSYIENRVNNLNSVDVQVTGRIVARPDNGAEKTIAEVPPPYQNCPPGGWCGPIEDIHNHYTNFHGVVWGTTWVHHQGVEVGSKSFGPTPLACDP